MIFFCKGVIETVKKFGWPPDIIHCHGWMTSLIPTYIRTAYKTEPLFQQSKIVYSLYDNAMDDNFKNDFFEKASINNLDTDILKVYEQEGKVNLHKGALAFSDAIIKGSEVMSEETDALLVDFTSPVLDYVDKENYLPAYKEFYHSLMEAEEEVEG